MASAEPCMNWHAIFCGDRDCMVAVPYQNLLDRLAYRLKGDEWREILQVMRWSCAASGRFWRSLYKHGLWMGRQEGVQLAQDGWDWAEAWAKLQNPSHANLSATSIPHGSPRYPENKVLGRCFNVTSWVLLWFTLLALGTSVLLNLL